MGSFDHMALGSDDEGHVAFKGQDRRELQLNQKPSLCRTELKSKTNSKLIECEDHEQDNERNMLDTPTSPFLKKKNKFSGNKHQQQKLQGEQRNNLGNAKNSYSNHPNHENLNPGTKPLNRSILLRNAEAGNQGSHADPEDLGLTSPLCKTKIQRMSSNGPSRLQHASDITFSHYQGNSIFGTNAKSYMSKNALDLKFKI